jgi:hypothetical protein
MSKRRSNRVLSKPRSTLEKREPNRSWTHEEDQRLARGLANINIHLNEANQMQNVPEGFWDMTCGFFDRSANACRIRALNMLRGKKHNNVARDLDMIKEEDVKALEFLVNEMLPLAQPLQPSSPVSDETLGWEDLLLPEELPADVPSTPRLRPSPPPIHKVPPCPLPKKTQARESSEISLLPKMVSTRRSLFDDAIQPTFAFCNPHTPTDRRKHISNKRMRVHSIDLTSNLVANLHCDESMDAIEEALTQPKKQVRMIYKVQLASKLW